MTPTLPSSLSPHICILHSPDLIELLESASLPPLPQILQSFSPLSQVTTRTTSLNSVPHASFALRFSDLVEIENGTHEDEEQRAGRTLDWISSRVNGRCARWVEMVEAHAASGNGDGPWKDRTPWWEEVKRCVEGDHIPNKSEGWNHPVSIILAVSTMAVNPLQALQDLHARVLDLPSWIDIAHLRYSLIIHPSNSPLTNPIAESLFNAVKKQYGLHSYLLPLQLPTSPHPAPVPVPFPPPRLPIIPQSYMSPMPSHQQPSGLVTSPMPTPSISPAPQALNGDRVRSLNQNPSTGANALLLCDDDIQQVGRFFREFVVMSLVPWMEKCVVDWNETYSSSRRLPSRLFSSTRRLFGSSYAASAPPTVSSTPTHGSNPSVSSISSRITSHAPNSSISSITSTTSLGGGSGGTVTQQRRLAEFATVLGDYKLAVSVWEVLRKDSKGGSDILPLLLSSSPALALHASNAIMALRTQYADMPAYAQLRALVYAVRWDVGIDLRDFIGDVLEGDRWLVQAAGAAEETPTALLLSHAAFLSAKRSARRRSALWYLSAADRLEKGGIKPLAMYFFRKSHQMYKLPLDKDLSPSFWESEGKDPDDRHGFDAILPGIEHELGRLLYTTGDTEGAVRYFLGLLREPRKTLAVSRPTGLGFTNGNIPPEEKQTSTDKVYLEDFRVAFKHFKATEGDRWASADLHLQITFCQVKQCRIRLPGDAIEGDAEVWREREEAWATFWKPQGNEKLEKGGRAAVDETFWLDLVIRNPLDVEVNFSGLTVVVQDTANEDDVQGTPDHVEVEVVDDITLSAKETRTIPVAIKCTRPASLAIIQAKYEFLSLLPVTESLAIRGRRLHDTPNQRQNQTYAPDILIKVDVEDTAHRLQATFVDNRHLVLAQGECKRMNLWFSNSGKRNINELWVVAGTHDEIWVDVNGPNTSSSSSLSEILQSNNSLAPRRPYQVLLEAVHSSSTLAPGESLSLSLILHASHVAEQDLCILFVFREAGDQAFYCRRLIRHYEVMSILALSTSSQPSRSLDHSFFINLEVENVTTSTGIRLTQISALSPLWECFPLTDDVVGTISPRQVARASFGANRWDGSVGVEETKEFVSRKLRTVLLGEAVDPSDSPPIKLHCRHVSKGDTVRSVNDSATRHFIHSGRKNSTAHSTASHHAYIPSALHPSVFPLYNPSSVDLIVFWEIPSQERSGHILLSGLNLGAGHAPLKEIIEEAESAKVKRSMYAETQRERRDVLEAVKNCEWNMEMNPIVVTVQDGVTFEHDFSKGPCSVPVQFTLRNHSLTNPCRYVLKLSPGSSSHPPSSSILPPQYAGRLTLHGQLSPSQSATISAKLSVSLPGSYALDGWLAESEVGERPISHLSKGTTDTVMTSPWIVRQRYEQGPRAGPRPCITVVDTRAHP